jgi:hypothetical protein
MKPALWLGTFVTPFFVLVGVEFTILTFAIVFLLAPITVGGWSGYSTRHNRDTTVTAQCSRFALVPPELDNYVIAIYLELHLVNQVAIATSKKQVVFVRVDGDFVTRFDFLEFLSHKGSNGGLYWRRAGGDNARHQIKPEV